MEQRRYMRAYNIVTPDFQITSGGIRVMYALHGWLLAKGQISFINGMMGKDYISVYPEIYHGNPAESKHVVRYILNKPGVMHLRGTEYKPYEIDKNDKVWCFSELYNEDPFKVDKDHIMFLPMLDLHTFKVTNTKKRKGKCKLIGKGTDLHLPETEGLTEVTRPFANDQSALANYLNECEVMYSYDNNSAMFEIARLCGCRIVVIPSIYTKEEFSKYEPGMNGISYGLEENVELDAEMFRIHYMRLRKVFEIQLELFIEETQNG